MSSNSQSAPSPATHTSFENIQPNLPAEVIELIVDELGVDAKQDPSLSALLSVALTSRRLCMRAYKYIFSELHIMLVGIFGDEAHLQESGDTLDGTLHQLHDILIHGLAFPGLAMVYHLRSVWVTIHFDNILDIPSIFTLSKFTEILQALHGPAHGIACFRFEIEDPAMEFRETPLPINLLSEKLDPPFTEAFYALCHSPNLRSLHLKNVGLFSTTLRGTRLENIHLQQIIFENDPREPLEPLADLQPNIVVQPTTMTLIYTKRHRNLSDPTVYNPLSLADLVRVNTSDLVEFFHPTYHINKSVAELQAFDRLTSLTLMCHERSGSHIPLNLLPSLRSLRVKQSLLLPTNSSFGYSTLHLFFNPQPNSIRDLGSVTNLTVETQIVRPGMFLNDDGNDRTGTVGFGPFTRYKATRLSWRDVDVHLANSASAVELQRISFVFKFVFTPEEDLPSGSDNEAWFITANTECIAAYFPLLSALRSFSVDVLVEKKQDKRKISGVDFKGPTTGRW